MNQRKRQGAAWTARMWARVRAGRFASRGFRVAAVTAASAALSTSLLLTTQAGAVSTRTFVIDDADSLAAGKLEGTAALSDGSVVRGLSLRRIALSDIPVAYSYARGPDGSAFIGTGNDGKVLKLQGDQVSVVADTDQLLVSSLALGEGGTLYAGTLPEGRIYAIGRDGRSRELARPAGAEHVWALAYDARRRTLFAGTGPEGKVFAIDSNGRADVYYDTEAAHVMSLALDEDGSLYAGTSDEAVVLRLTGPGRAEVVYDFPGNEITAIAARRGVLAVAANDFPEPPAAATTKTTGDASSSTTASRPRAGKGKLYRVEPGGRAEQMLAHDDSHLTSVELAADGTMYAGTGKDGRILRVTADRARATWVDVDERQVLAIDLLGPSPLFVTADAAAVYRIAEGTPATATWTSDVLDATFHARFGELRWRAEGRLELQTRTGNTEEPDATWGEWSAPLATPGPIRSPAARFLQVRARFPATGEAVLRAVTAFYLPQNQRAALRDITLTPPAGAKQAKKAGEPPAERSARYKLTWKVDNVDEDSLRYRLRFRSEDQSRFRDMLRDGEVVTEPEYAWDTSSIPDGFYVVEVEASDELANPEALTLRAAATSEPILIDNHPPSIDGLRAERGRITGTARDSMGPIARLEHAVDGGEFRVFFPGDHLLDTGEEQFALPIEGLTPGEHIVAVRAVDAGGNWVTAEVVVRR